MLLQVRSPGHPYLLSRIRVENEFAHTVEDILLRRTKLGLFFQPNQVEVLNHWLQDRQSFRFELNDAVLKYQ